MKKLTFTLLAASGLLSAAASSAFAQASAFYGLGAGGNSVSYYTASGTTPTTYAVTGLSPADNLVNIDYYTSGTRQLFGMGSSGTLYTLAQSGDTTFAATVNVANAVPGATVIDFNPAASRLRVYAGTSNFRLTPGTGVLTADGTLAYNSGDANFGATPALTAAAYINNFAGSTATALYSLDSTFDTLVMNTGTPAFSGLTTLATLTLGGDRFDITAGTTGFDIFSPDASTNLAYVSSGNSLYSVNLADGVLTSVGTQTGANIIDIAFVPEPGTYAMLAVGGLLLGGIAVRRQRQAVG